MLSRKSILFKKCSLQRAFLSKSVVCKEHFVRFAKKIFGMEERMSVVEEV